MDKVELVIKIDKDAYEARQHWVANPKKMIGKVDMAIANGIPLPKGHGRIGDLDALRCENADFDTYKDYCIMFDEIEAAETIIEADKSESKDRESR